MFLEAIILESLSHINSNRTISSIYHIIVGKRSIQTVQDSNLYQIGQFYGVLPLLKKEDFDDIIIKLSKEKIIKKSFEKTYFLTQKGFIWLEKNFKSVPMDYLNGIKHHQNDRIFYSRLILMVQVLTNSKMNHSSYIPVIDETSIRKWVINRYQLFKVNLIASLKQLYNELFKLLTCFTDDEAIIFVSRLTGYKHYGSSLDQIAKRFDTNAYDIQLLITGIIHRILDELGNRPSDYKVLYYFVNDLSMHNFISLSASKTKEFLNREYDVSTISKLRQLKVNTIYDHIVEIALTDSKFDIRPYVSLSEQEEVLGAFDQLNSTKLKDIKDNVHSKINYFQIRLVLARIKDK